MKFGQPCHIHCGDWGARRFSKGSLNRSTEIEIGENHQFRYDVIKFNRTTLCLGGRECGSLLMPG